MGLHAALLFHIAKDKTTINLVKSDGLRGLPEVVHPGKVTKREWDKGLLVCMFE